MANQSGKKNAKVTGRHKAKINRYYSNTFKPRKILHCLKRNGRKATREWADSHDCISVYRRLANDNS